MTATRVMLIPSTGIEDHLPALVSLLAEAVNAGASLGFLPPVTPVECERYWRSLRDELSGASRLLFGIWMDDRLVGTGQLALPRATNGRHRAEVNKVMVAAGCRRQGVGRSLLFAIHESARRRGRFLLLLTTRRGDNAELFYRRQGYQEAGVIPGYTIGPEGEAHDSLLLYQWLAPAPPRPAAR
jgi:ribosomal protein S18 acetylase RimI-like enzyme